MAKIAKMIHQSFILQACVGLVAWQLAGCNQVALNDPSWPYAKVPIGTALEIHQAITVPPAVTRVYMQLGRLVRTFDRYQANCNIEVRKIDWEKPQTIEPGSYRVTRVQNSTEEVVEARPLWVAALGSKLAGIDDGGGATFIYAGYHLWLEGPDPNVRRVSCRGVYADPADAAPPSINDIRQALGDLITLKTPAERS